MIFSHYIQNFELIMYYIEKMFWLDDLLALHKLSLGDWEIDQICRQSAIGGSFVGIGIVVSFRLFDLG